MAETEKPNGAPSTPAEEPKRSLRDTLEAAWDKVVENAPDDNDEPDAGDDAGHEPPPTVDNQGQPRDEHGRFRAREPGQPGEAEQRPQRAEHPAPPSTPQQPQPQHPAPPPAGQAAQAPAHWDAEAKAAFEEQTDKGKQFLLRRHSEMESFVQQRVQASAQAANFAQSLEPIMRDPVITGSLREAGVNFSEAIHQWAGFHRRFMTDPVPMIAELIQRSGVDPAVFVRQSPGAPGAPPPEALKDPALKFIADHMARQNGEVVSLRNDLLAMQRAGAERQQQEVMRVTRWGIDSFAEETDQQGNKLHPHFDDPRVMQHVIDLFRANPRRDLREAYDMAVWMVPELRQTFLQAAQTSAQQRQDNQRARQQVRSNITGRTHPVAPPPRPEGQKRSLRDVLEEAADKVGIE